MARRKKSGAEGILIVFAIIIGAIVQAFEALGQFLRTHGDAIIGLLILAAGLWMAVRLILWLFRTTSRALKPKEAPAADVRPVVTVTVQPLVTPPTPRVGTAKPPFDSGRVSPDPTTRPPSGGGDFTKLRGSTSERWVPPRESVTVHGFEIHDGMVYVGAGGISPDASLIDPALVIRIVKGQGYETRQTHYWPAYGDITPEARGAYLTWLAAGKNAPTADIGYVFLYFYGLERRVLLELRSAVTLAEYPQIEAEIRRLLGIYGDNGSFRGYATSLLEFLEARAWIEAPRPDAPPESERSWQIPFELRVGLAKLVADGQPLPGPWAYSWWRAHPETRLRTPAERCPDEFRRLFIERYHQVHGAGLVIKPNKARLTAVHRPASPSFNGRVFEAKFDLPDVTVIPMLSGPMKRFTSIADGCYEALDRYSRYLGRNPGKVGTFDAMLELPVTLWPAPLKANLERIRSMAPAAGLSPPIAFEKLRKIFPEWQSVGKGSYAAFASGLGEFGIGIEPDPRFGGATPGDEDQVVLFPDAPSALATAPSVGYQAAALSLHLAVAVSLADGGMGTQERETLMRQLEDWLHLEAGERNRLQAHLCWLSVQPAGLGGIKKRLEAVPGPAREALGDFLVRVAHADGSIAPAEVKLLEKLFKLLELDAGSLYSKLHMAPSEPVTVRPPADGSQGFSIPQRPAEKLAGGLDLDLAKVSALHAESTQISGILHAIFQDASQEISAEPDETAESATAADTGLWGLSPEFSGFLRLLATRPEWSRAELEELAADRSLMLDGALEHINEAAFDRFDQPFTEGDDPLEINQELIGEIAV